MPQPPLASDTDTAVAESASFTAIIGMSQSAMAFFWLSNPHARSILNDQLAELLRATLESRHGIDEPRFSYCPICGEALDEYDYPDGWAKGLRCQTGHSWALRGGRLRFDASLTIHAEQSDAVVGRLIAGWLQNTYMEPYLPESIRRVLMSSPLCPRDAIERNE
jgi:hypothetical protein